VEDQDIYYFYRKTLFENGGKKTCELRMGENSDTFFWAWLEATIAEHEDGVSFCRIVLSDITERKAIEAGLEKTRKELEIIKKSADEAHEFADSVINTVREPLISLGQDLRVVTVSRSFYEFFKVKPEETVGQLIYDLGNKQWDIPRLRELLENILPEKTTFDNYEVEHDFASIGKRTMLLNARQIEQGMGKERIILLAIEDITERKQAEEEKERLQSLLQQSQKIEAIGTLTGGIAHDYNNLMSIIMGNLSMAIEEAEPDSLLTDFLSEANMASFKARDLTHELMSLSRGGAPVKEVGSLGELSKDATDIIPADSGISLTKSISHDLKLVSYDPYKMGSVFRNVLTNAVEAMPNGGMLKIKAENFQIDDETQDSSLPLKPGGYIHISIQDQGKGIPKEHLDKIFDPYFSTKAMAVQKGMGLGLATAYAIVQKHGGHIAIDSSPGAGTTVNIYLPAASETVESDGTIASEDDKSLPVKRVLVMDDEEMLRTLTRQMLERIGYAVETVKDGLEAIEAYKKQKDLGEPFDAVILDLTIKGGMGGEQTIRELLKIDPGVKAIVSSGYFNDPVLADFRKYGFKGAMAKPYDKKNLKEVLEKLFG